MAFLHLACYIVIGAASNTVNLEEVAAAVVGKTATAAVHSLIASTVVAGTVGDN